MPSLINRQNGFSVVVSRQFCLSLSVSPQALLATLPSCFLGVTSRSLAAAPEIVPGRCWSAATVCARCAACTAAMSFASCGSELELGSGPEALQHGPGLHVVMGHPAGLPYDQQFVLAGNGGALRQNFLHIPQLSVSCRCRGAGVGRCCGEVD